MIESKMLFSESYLGGPIMWGLIYFQTPSAFWIQQVVRCAGGAALQAMSKCPLAARLVLVPKNFGKKIGS